MCQMAEIRSEPRRLVSYSCPDTILPIDLSFLHEFTEAPNTGESEPNTLRLSIPSGAPPSLLTDLIEALGIGGDNSLTLNL